jgi:large subunit ribosomal protein L17
MRHGDKINNLGRKAAHRSALLSNLASQLIANKRITTTLAKAKALRTYVEPLITKAKENTTHQRRIVFSHLQDKEAIKELFDVVRLKIEGRPGGYTRIIKLGTRVGDNAELALIELVDYNDVYGKGTTTETEATAKRTRRGRSKRSGEGTASATAATTPATEVASANDLPAATAANADEAVINNTEEQAEG